MIWIKTNTEKKVDKVLPSKIFILISFNIKALTQVNSQHMQVNFNTFPSSFRVNCVIRINVNLGPVHKEWKLLSCKFYPGQIPRNQDVNAMLIHSHVNRTLEVNPGAHFNFN